MQYIAANDSIALVVWWPKKKATCRRVALSVSRSTQKKISALDSEWCLGCLMAAAQLETSTRMYAQRAFQGALRTVV